MRWQQQLGIALAAVVCSAGAALAQLQTVGNASFETACTYDVAPANGNWTGFFGGPPNAVLFAAVDSSQAFTGAQSLRLSITGAGGSFCGMQQPIGGVVPATSYTLRYRARGGVALLNGVEARVEWLNLAGGFLPDPNGQFSNNVNITSQLNGTWQQFTWTGVAPNEATQARIVFAVQTFAVDPLNPGFNTEVFIDDVEFVTSSVQPTTGKCCAPGGGCQVTLESGCTAPSSWTANTTCSPNTCAGAPGACCNPNGTGCAVLDPAICTSLGANFAGSGVLCSPTSCPAGPGPGCRADFDNSGTRNVADIFAFLSAWFAGCP